MLQSATKQINAGSVDNTEPKHVFAGLLVLDKKIMLVRHEHKNPLNPAEKTPELTIFFSKAAYQGGKQQTETLFSAIKKKHDITVVDERKLNHIKHKDALGTVEAGVWKLKLDKSKKAEEYDYILKSKQFFLISLKELLGDIASGNTEIRYTFNSEMLALSGLSKHIILENRYMLK